MSSIDLRNYNIKKTKKVVVKEKNKAATNFFNQEIKVLAQSFGDKKKEKFYSELNILFSAGVDISAALELIVEEQTKKADKKLFSDIRADVVNGQSLSNAM